MTRMLALGLAVLMIGTATLPSIAADNSPKKPAATTQTTTKGNPPPQGPSTRIGNFEIQD